MKKSELRTLIKEMVIKEFTQDQVTMQALNRYTKDALEAMEETLGWLGGPSTGRSAAGQLSKHVRGISARTRNTGDGTQSRDRLNEPPSDAVMKAQADREKKLKGLKGEAEKVIKAIKAFQGKVGKAKL